MNTSLKRGIQILGTVAILGTSACVVDPNYSGVDYGSYGGYDYDDSYTTSTRVIGNGSNFALSTGFLVGNYYYYDNYYYPVNYYSYGGSRYYRPVFDRPYRIHPDARYRNLNYNQLEQWRRHQGIRFDPNYRPRSYWDDNGRYRWNDRNKDYTDGNRGQTGWGNNRPNTTRPTESTRPITRPTRPTESTRPIVRPTQPTESTRPIVRPTRPIESTRPVVRPTQPNGGINRPQIQPSRPSVNNSRPPVQQQRPLIQNRPVNQGAQQSVLQRNDRYNVMRNMQQQNIRQQTQPRLRER